MAAGPGSALGLEPLQVRCFGRHVRHRIGHDAVTRSLEEHRDRLLSGSIAPLDLAGPVVTLDTTDLDSIDYDTLIRDLRSALRMEQATE